MKLREVVDDDIRGERRITNPRMDGDAIGLHKVDEREFLFLFREGKALRMLSKREIKAFFEDEADDWRFSNQ